MAVSVRTRFEVFKRDEFTCRYCGRKTPDVILEVDHIVPVCEGGGDDQMNLATSCWDCNRGKAGNPLASVLVCEDPTEKAILMIERDRQLREYDAVLNTILESRMAQAEGLEDFWHELTGRSSMPKNHFTWLTRVVGELPSTIVKEAMLAAYSAGKTSDLRYVMAVIRNRREAAANG